VFGLVYGVQVFPSQWTNKPALETSTSTGKFTVT